ncbi:MAG: hypothetical protein HWD86_09520 [Kangiellaceae bacterium]|nr:hypothetical protein [Kangiellaceae bacterium]
MKNVAKTTLVLSFSAICLAACTTTTHQMSHDGQKFESEKYKYELDKKHMVAIERANRTSSQNVQTVWINPPLKRVKAKDN